MFDMYASLPKAENTVRIAVMGEAACGKTSIVEQHLYGMFRDRYWVTVGDIHHTQVVVQNKKTFLEIWDCPGGYCFEYARQLAIGACDAFVLVCKVTDEFSFETVLEIRDDIISKRGLGIPIVIAGTMTDLPSWNRFDTLVSLSTFVENSLNCRYYEVSAKSPVGLNFLFEDFLQYELKPAEPEKLSQKERVLQNLKKFMCL